jgi:ribosomal protein S17E
MGKVRIRKVKVLAKEILKVIGDQIATDFETNKILVGQLLTGRVSKKIRNKVAGYLTTLAKIEVKKASQQEKELA